MTRIAICFFCICAFAQDGQKPVLTARELYYIAAPASAQPKRPSPPKKATGSNPSQEASTDSKNSKSMRPAGTAVIQDAQLVMPGTGIKTSAPAPASGAPLGLKYTLWRAVDGHFETTPAGAEFRTGDHIRLQVEANGPGYLRILNLGPTGNWNTLFPEDGGSGHVEGFQAYTIQSKFDEPSGTEKLFLIFTREADAEVPTSIASIDNSVVSQLRTRIARDLIVEPVGPTTPGSGSNESAVYVVNPTGNSDSRLVADLLLMHK